MAYPDYSQSDYVFFLVYNDDYSSSFGTSFEIGKYGFAPINVFDLNFKHSEAIIPESDGYNRLDDGKMAPADLILRSQMHEVTSNDLADAIFTIGNILQLMAESKYGFLYFGLHDGGSPVFYRKYLDIIRMGIPIIHNTRGQITGPININFRCPDPGIYNGVAQNDVITVTAGAGNTAMTVDGNVGTKRFYVQIIKNGADNPTNVTVTKGVGGPNFTITGALTGLNDYWLIDMLTSEVLFYDASGPTFSDASDLFSGERFSLDPASTTVYVIDTATSDFTVTVKHIGRYM